MIVSFTEEEGARFADGVLGSSVAAGDRSVEDALALEADGETIEAGEETHEKGTETLEAALDRIGYRGEGRLDASTWTAWVERHVEQHTALEAAGVPGGVVTAVTDAGMLFPPSHEGISHSPREWTDWADCAATTRALAATLADLARK